MRTPTSISSSPRESKIGTTRHHLCVPKTLIRRYSTGRDVMTEPQQPSWAGSATGDLLTPDHALAAALKMRESRPGVASAGRGASCALERERGQILTRRCHVPAESKGKPRHTSHRRRGSSPLYQRQGGS